MLKSKREVMRDVGRVRNRKIKIVHIVHKEAGETDTEGFPTDEVWVVFRETWANIRGLRGREFYEANVVQAQDNKVFNFAYFEGLSEDMYIEHNDKRYNIQSVNNLYERNVEYEVHAKEVSQSV